MPLDDSDERSDEADACRFSFETTTLTRLRALKKKLQREGAFREMKLHDHYEKPSERKAREKAEAVRRARKLMRKRLQREGLLPSKPRPQPRIGAPAPAAR